jgi:hypothetical protein
MAPSSFADTQERSYGESHPDLFAPRHLVELPGRRGPDGIAQQADDDRLVAQWERPNHLAQHDGRRRLILGCAHALHDRLRRAGYNVQVLQWPPSLKSLAARKFGHRAPVKHAVTKEAEGYETDSRR